MRNNYFIPFTICILILLLSAPLFGEKINIPFGKLIMKHRHKIQEGNVIIETIDIYLEKVALIDELDLNIHEITYYHLGELVRYTYMLHKGWNYITFPKIDKLIKSNKAIDQLFACDYSLAWNDTVRSPCIDTGDPETQYNDPDESRSDMGAIPAIAHNYDYRTLTVGDDINWVSLPILDTLTTGLTEPLYVLEEAGLLDPLILDQVFFENNYEPVIYYDDYGILYIDPEFDEFRSIEGYKIRLKENAPNSTIGITGFLEDHDAVITLEADAENGNWIGYFLEYSQMPQDAFTQVWDNLTYIKAEDWAMYKKTRSMVGCLWNC